MSQNVRKFRKAAGLSQQALAALTGYSQAYISQLENGVEKNPTKDCLEKLAGAMGIPVGKLFEDGEEETNGKDANTTN